MIIWTGWGILVGIAGAICMAATQYCVNTATNDPQYYLLHAWPKVLGLGIAAVVSLPIGYFMNRGETRQLFDPESGQNVTVHLRGGHSLFFIPVQYWWLVFAFIGAVIAFKDIFPPAESSGTQQPRPALRAPHK
jgi:hypothetical protein